MGRRIAVWGIGFTGLLIGLVGCETGSGTSVPGEDVQDAAPEIAGADAATELPPETDEASPDLAPETGRDDAPPEVEFVAPQEGAAVEGLVAVQVDAQDEGGVVEVTLRVDGATLATDHEPPWEFEWDTAGLGAGDYVLEAEAEDTAGNVGTATISVTVAGACDKDGDCPPTVEFQAPDADAVLRGETEIKAAASDDDAVVKVRFLVDEGLLMEDDQVPFKVAWDTSEFDDGVHDLELIAVDTTAKTGSAHIQVTVDNTPPELTLVSPPEGAVLHDAIPWILEVSDNLELDRVELSVDGGEPAVLTEAPWELEGDGSGLAAGPHAIEAVAFDMAGNEVSVEREVLVDRPPQVSFLSPAEGEPIPGEVMVHAEAGDDLGVDAVALFVDDQWTAQLAPAGGAAWDTVWVPPFEKADYVLSLIATDGLGQEGQAAVSVTVDHPVTVTLLACGDDGCAPLVGGEELGGAVALQAEAQDDGAEILVVDLSVDGELLAHDTTAPWEATWDTTGAPDGPHVLAAAAWNALDEAGEALVEVQVNNCDLDHDGFTAAACGGPDCDDGDAGLNPSAADTVGDDADQNCDGLDGVDGDGDGWASEASGGTDCDDDDGDAHPCGDDLPDDGVDGNCDGEDALSCDDCLPCTADGAVLGGCVHAPLPDGSACDDGDLCTEDGTCQEQICLPGPTKDCDDDNPCTADGCLPASGCYHLSMDGIPCEGGVCANSACCAPDCTGATCGDDGCGGSCGSCDENYECEDGLCVLPGMSCGEYVDCLGICDQDPACMQACADLANPIALLQWDQFITCLQDNGAAACETAECLLEIQNGPCLEPMLGCLKPECFMLDSWFGFCGEDAACKALVLEYAAPGAMESHDAMIDCLDAHHYDECETEECQIFILNQICGQVSSACYSGELSCVGISYCNASCETETCSLACFYAGTPAAQAQYWAFLECHWDACGAEPTNACWDAASEGPCAPYIEACEAGECLPPPSCAGAECGSDGCGGFCGQCPEGELCVDGGCVPCDPTCTDKECGPDGCGGICGTCSGEASDCVGGVCVDPDSCDCSPWQICAADGCEDPPSMGAAAYGGEIIGLGCYGFTFEGCCAGTVLYYCDDQSGECPGGAAACLVKLECGPQWTCGWDETYFMCVEPPPDKSPDGALWCDWYSCEPNCEGKLCGPDGCGGVCGLCQDGEACFEGECHGGPGCAATDEVPGCGGCVCEDCVCDLDPYCCETEWDAQCVQECLGDCGGCGHCEPDCEGPPSCSPDGCGGFCDGPCDDENPCTEDYCDLFTGCVHEPVLEMTPCGDGSFCVEGTCVPFCQNECEAGTAGCDDLVPWTCELPEGELCTVKVEAAPCPEGQTCFEAECCTPDCGGGSCGDDGCGGSCGSCCPLDPYAYGPCAMILGAALVESPGDGALSCVLVSGCGCGDDCESFFVSVQACEAACLDEE